MQIYAGSFFAIPLVRWFLIRKRNSDIEKRNKARQQWAKVLELPDISLTQKVYSSMHHPYHMQFNSAMFLYAFFDPSFTWFEKS
jgi:hypothetical protein